jgi:hypothetical protein
MGKALQMAGLLLIGAALAVCEQAATGGRKDGRPAFRPILPKGGGAPKGGQKAGPRLSNPNSEAARLYRANPEQRERALEKLPFNLQQRIRRELDWFDGLSKDQQQMVLTRSERLAALSPEQQRAFTEQLRALNRLEPERRRMVRQALMRLQRESDDQRKIILGREQFRSRFSPEELQIITDLAAVMLPQ